ncbi:hypothetical protein tloyanaT_01940 [Thalassotalea loyana]|uniref:Uncharacterized protein n=1 Tax=Thalassotalea loyana TaxID=280483 RepID=A0ABQ6HAY7_9GAMM|nr:hypothetical protein [Thalassotalea loyana]GLX83942.1 hypothetical protein tloyanaT_01940 [Thalassotalea loyana]
MRLTLILIAAFVFMSHASFAQNNSGQANINYYKIDESRIVVYALSPTKFIDNAQCNGTGESTAVAVSTSRDNFNELYASIMLAHAHNKKIAFWLDGACTPAMVGGPFPSASMVYVHQ